MSYCIKTITNKEVADFLLNPFERACYVGKKLYQKYPKEDLLDELIVLSERYSSYDVAGIINYNKQEVFVQKERLFESELLEGSNFVRLSEVKDQMKAMIYAKIDEIKSEKMPEILVSEDYLKMYKSLKDTYFQPMVNTILGTNHYRGNVSVNTQQTVVSYIQSLSLQNFIDFHCNKFGDVERMSKEIALSPNQIQFIAFENVKQEAIEYVNKGVFSDKEKNLKNFLDKTKDCEAQRFTVVDIRGHRVSCRNSVNSETKLYAAGDNGYSVLVDDIKEVVYKSKKIYKRGEF